ncbi:MAG TPA: hypothetical protein VKR62_18885 [Roseiarcus sp.]|nr:hypothetical protein [Roseiarcus sp.]
MRGSDSDRENHIAPASVFCQDFVMLSLCHASKPSGPRLTPIRLPPSWVEGPWLDAGHPAFRVGRQPALGLVQQGEFIAERVADARAAADRDVERRFDSLAAGAEEERERLLDIVNQNIGFRADAQVAHEFGVGVRKGEPDRFLASPKHPMPKAVAIEGDGRVKVGDAKQEIVELTKQRAVGGHGKFSPPGALDLRSDDVNGRPRAFASTWFGIRAGSVKVFAGEFETAVPMLEAALDRSQKIHTQYLTSLTGALLGETLAPRDPKRALDVAESALGVARACGHRAVEAELLRVRAASLVNVDCEAAETANKKAMSLRSGWVLA